MSNDDADAKTWQHALRAREGKDESVRWLVDRFGPALLAQAGYRLRGPLGELCDATDLVCDIWLNELPRLPVSLAGDDRYTTVVLTYLSRALALRIADLKARFSRDVPAPDRDPGHTLPEATVKTVRDAVRSDGHADLLRFVERLDATDRAVLILRAVERRTDRSIAALRGVHSGSVADRCSAVLERIREQHPGTIFSELEPEL